MNSNTFSNPSIGTDHLRGCWTVNVETGLPGKVKANDQITLGESRFVILPKIHWLSPIVATEIKGSGCVIVGGNDELDIPNAEAITLEELLVFVRQLCSEDSSAKENVTKGKLVPLLVDEIVRCPKSVELTVDDNLQYWYELSRGFILDPQSWNPSLLSHEPVQLKCSMNDTRHDSEIDHVKQVDEAFIKPEILARSIQQQHKFADPLNHCLAQKKGFFSYNDLKRSTKDLFRSRRCESAEILSKNFETNTHCDNESAYLRSCMEYLVFDVSNNDGAKCAQRVGYLLLEVLKTLNCELDVDGLDTSSLLECDAWVVLLTEVSQDIQRWDFLHLVIRAIDLSVHKAHIIEWRGSNLNRRLHFLGHLLAARKFWWNAVAVEVIRVFHIGTHKGLDKYAEDAETARNISNELLEQKDWQNAERLAVVIQELDMVETLLRQLSLLNMTKAVKRLQNSAIQCEHHNLSNKRSKTRSHSMRKPIDHEKNRSLYQDSGSELRWKYVDSIEDIWEIIRHLEKYESASYSEDNGRERVVIRNLLVGIDCEWQPQTPMKQQRTVVNGHMQHRKLQLPCASLGDLRLGLC
ncbi:hypothetical protein PsorP6_016673 [Peronosclerospora sorghi]|uniref:Uncharacterized protein n=1 Tax=Peronosclerospora sorghi TaxID=230839 RepID=A0ACC0VNZ1_9STRA|nr:hypothetical protein PsorP6_016673 [Peronosclerospora sorghi]